MGKTFNGSLVPWSSTFNVTGTLPLDQRTVVDEIGNLTDGSIGATYKGMVVNVSGRGSLFVLIDWDATKPENWKELGNVDVIGGVQGELKDIISGVQSDIEKGLQGAQSNLQDAVDGIQSGMQSADEKHDKDIKGVQGQIDKLKEDHAKDIQTLLDDEGADATLNSFKEIANWIEEHGEQASALITQVNGIQNTIIPGVQTQLVTGIQGVQGQIDNLEKKHDDEILGVQTRITNEVEGIQSRITDEIEGVQTRITNEVDGIQSRITDEVDGIQTRITNEVEGLQSEIDAVKESGTQAIEELTELHKIDVVGLQNEIIEVTQSVEELTEMHKIDVVGLQTSITDLEDKHDVDIKGVQGQLKTAIDTLLDDKGASEKLDSFKEVADWINTHETDFENLQSLANSGIQGVQGQIDDLKKTVNESVQTEINNINIKIAGVQTQLETGIQGVQGQISDLETQHDKDIKGVQGQIDSSKIYVSEAGDDWLTEEVGGVPGGLSKDSSQISGKTISQILDMILYPTLQPDITNPTTSIIYGGNNTNAAVTLLKVGATLPLDTAFTGTQTKGSVTYVNADGNKDYTGDYSVDTTMNPSNFGGKAEERVYTVTRKVTYQPGPKLLDNKGGDSTKSSYAGGSLSNTKVFKGVYPIYINSGSSIETMVEQSVKDYHAGSIYYDITAQPETPTQKLEVHVPTTLTIDLKQGNLKYNSVSGKYDIEEGLVDAGRTTTHSINGVDVNYNVYVRTLDTNQTVKEPEKYRITINKKS